MERIKELVYKDINDILKEQLDIIDHLCYKYNIEDIGIWWKKLKKEQIGDYTGYGFFDNILENFTHYLSKRLEDNLLKYLPADGQCIYKRDYINSGISSLIYNDGKFFLDDDSKEYFYNKVICNLNIDQKEELLQDNLFRDLINDIGLKIYNTKEIRTLKIRNISQ